MMQTVAPYTEATLAPDERIVARARFHWLQWTSAIGLFVLLGWMIIPLIWVSPPFIRMATTELTVTTRRLILKSGWLTLTANETPLEAIESVHVHQTMLQRILGMGTIIVHGAGGGELASPVIADVVPFRQALENAVVGRSLVSRAS